MVFILILLNILALNNLPYGESVSGVYKSAGWLLISLSLLTIRAIIGIIRSVKEAKEWKNN
jgi:putative effector of murein hydrolase LrgA (UPF0299 family)